MKILINLIGGQPAPNYLAAKEIAPDKIINIYTDSTKNQHLNLCKALEIDTKSEHYSVNAFDYKNNENILNSILDKYLEGNEFILNFTGGTKIMSIAFFKIFNDKGLKSIYIDTENDNRIEFTKGDVNSFKINSGMNIKEYFNLYGQKILEQETKNSEISDVTDLMNFIFLNNFKLNDLLVKVYKEVNSNKNWLKNNHQIEKSGNTVIWNSIANKLIINFTNPDTISFELIGEKSIRFLISDWYEEIVYNDIINSKIFNEVSMNVRISLANKDFTKNELDVVAIKKDVLYIFECKSGNIKQEDINKLRAIKELFGTYAKIMLVSYFPIHDEVLKGKIKEFNIELLIHNSNQKNLKLFFNRVRNNPVKNINL